MTDLDARLREHAARWRAEQDEDTPRAVTTAQQALAALVEPPRRSPPRRRTVLAVAASVAAVGVIGAVTATLTHPSARGVVAAWVPPTPPAQSAAGAPSTVAGLTWTSMDGHVIVAPPARFLGPLTRAKNYPALGISLTPPPPTPAPALTAHDAYTRCASTLACTVDSAGPSISLAVVTTTNNNLRDVPTLAYVLIWAAVPCTGDNNAPPAPGAPPAPTTNTTCISVGLVNALTGQSLGSGSTNAPGG